MLLSDFVQRVQGWGGRRGLLIVYSFPDMLVGGNIPLACAKYYCCEYKVMAVVTSSSEVLSIYY